MRLTVVVWEFYLSLYVNADIYERLCTIYLVVYLCKILRVGLRNMGNKD